MDKLTSKRFGGKGKAAHVPNALAEGESASVLLAGHGEVSGDRSAAQEDPSGADWDALVRALVSNKSRKTSAAMAYHPEPQATMIETPTGWVRVIEGEAGYTLNTGETVKI